MLSSNWRRWRWAQAVLGGALLVAVGGCSDPFGRNDLGLTVSFNNDEVGPDAPVVLTVTAMNLGDPIVWGEGSSSCQLGAVVRVDSEDQRIDVRVCTDDLVPQGLGSGESLTEQWEWRAEVHDGMTIDTLPPGDYQVRAVAGDVGRSAPRTVRVVAAGQ